ncbi:hypothetical protein A2U01_0074326, partial [Trifolium medium]|nr:hypothetical protein [Trifolium medium]
GVMSGACPPHHRCPDRCRCLYDGFAALLLCLHEIFTVCGGFVSISTTSHTVVVVDGFTVSVSRSLLLSRKVEGDGGAAILGLGLG